MEGSRSVIVLACILFYLVLCIGVGLWALSRTRSSEEFFVAGRTLGVWVTSFAIFSSTLSGFGFVGGPGLVYNMGTSSFWMVICSPLGYCFAVFLLGKRLRLLAELRNSVSLPDIVAARYQSDVVRFFVALAILMGVVAYLGTQIMAMSTVLVDIINSMDQWPNVSLELCMFISVTVLVFYCMTGGIIASVYTDLVQGAIMVVAAVLVFYTCMTVIDGGLVSIVQTIMQDDREAVGPWGTQGIMTSLSWYLLFAVGLCGQPHVISKLMMTRDVGDCQRILPVSIASYALAALLWFGIGLAMRALVLQGSHPELTHPDAAAAVFLQNYTSPLLAGIVFAGLFAAIMSTADGFLNIGAAALVHDIPKALTGRTFSNELAWARGATLGIAVVAALFALYSGETMVALLGALGWGTFAAALVPVVALGLNWRRGTANAAVAAVIASLCINLGVRLLDLSIPFGMDAGALSMLLSMTLYICISLASPPPSLDKDVDRVMRI